MAPALIRDLRAVLWLAAWGLVRLARDRLAVRSLAWPGLLTAIALVAAAAVTAVVTRAPELVVPDDLPVALADELGDAGFVLLPDADPATAVAMRRGTRAILPEGEGWALIARTAGDVEALRVEAILRRHTPSAWQLEVPAPVPPDRPGAPASWMTGLMTVLFCLYGAVLGVGMMVRDQAILEVERSLAVARWVPALARWAAATAALALSLGAALALLRALIGVEHAAVWWLHGAIAGGSTVAIGQLFVTERAGFSYAVSRALLVSMALLVAGWQAALGWVPVASVAVLSRQGEAHPAVALLMVALVGGVVARGRS